MWKSARNILAVTLITALVWVFAESETLREAKVSARVIIAPASDGSLDARAVGRTAQEFIAGVTFSAPGAQMASVEARLRDPIVLQPGDGGVPREPGDYTLELARLIGAVPELQRVSASVIGTEPATVSIRIDALETRELPVSVRTPEADLAGPAVALPATVRVTMKRGDAESLPPTAAVIAEVPPGAFERLVPGVAEVVAGVRLRPPPGLSAPELVRIDPPAVDVRLTVRSKTAETVIARVPVHLRVAPGELTRWNIEVPESDRALIDVRVAGPADLVRQVESRAIPVIAVVPLSFEDLERGITSKEVVFPDLPAALQADPRNRTVQLRITRRQ
ncbi:MAG TPA: hypothetical protein VD971_05490 [Phycisphaerales bacterium]|nr:hypothetical protein [Phycisphaerales bacterium]